MNHVFDFYVKSTKDPVDIALAMDAVQLASERSVEVIAIAAKDVDFAAVHRRVRSLGLCSYVLQMIYTGQPKILHNALIDSCTGSGEHQSYVRI